jgi:heparan-alpha-glucosaminide N-acetyltransferase
MIFVNYGGGGYTQFDHAPWHGITIADIVFPFFVWILGTSFVFSLKNALDKGISKRLLIKKIAIRTIKLFVSLIFITKQKSIDI